MHNVQGFERARQIAYAVAMLLILGVILIVLDGRDALDPVKGVAGQALNPVSRTLSSVDGPTFGKPLDDSEVANRLEAVTAERDALVAENARLKEVAAEVDGLREQLNFRQARPELELLTANVVARDPQSLGKYLIIDRGSDAGIKVGMAVVSPNFFVGQVVEVDPQRSRVLLVIDSGFQTGAILQTSRGTGIVYGLWQDGGRAEMRHIPLDTEISSDELVVTSGLTQGIPAGLVIGRILDLNRDELGNEITASVLPLVNFDELKAVTVIIGSKPQ